jgi:hypothetical protein
VNQKPAERRACCKHSNDGAILLAFKLRLVCIFCTSTINIYTISQCGLSLHISTSHSINIITDYSHVIWTGSNFNFLTSASMMGVHMRKTSRGWLVWWLSEKCGPILYIFCSCCSVESETLSFFSTYLWPSSCVCWIHFDFLNRTYVRFYLFS